MSEWFTWSDLEGQQVDVVSWHPRIIALVENYLVALEVKVNAPVTPSSGHAKVSMAMPQFVNDVAIYLNGWTHEYAEKSEISNFGAKVGPLTLEPGYVTWIQNSYMYSHSVSAKSCSYSIVIGWDKNVLNVDSAGRFIASDFITSSVPIVQLPGKIPNDFQPSAPVHLLPAGYICGFGDEWNFLQCGYSRGKRRPDGTWVSRVILKDDHTRRVNARDWMAVLQGTDVGGRSFFLKPLKVRQPIFSNCIQLGQQEPQVYTCDGLPFDLALPVLNGWNIYNTCSDDEVKAIGVWISDIQYTKDVNGTGTLKFTVYGKHRPFVPEIAVIGFGHNASVVP